MAKHSTYKRLAASWNALTAAGISPITRCFCPKPNSFLASLSTSKLEEKDFFQVSNFFKSTFFEYLLHLNHNFFKPVNYTGKA